MNILEYAEKEKLSLSCRYVPARPDRKWVRGAGDSPIESINNYAALISEKTIVKYKSYDVTTFDVPQLEPLK